MEQQATRRRRHSGRKRSTERARFVLPKIPGLGLVVRWLAIAVLTIIAALFLVRHYASVQPVDGVLYNTFWPTDGAEPLIAAAKHELRPRADPVDGDAATAEGARTVEDAAAAANGTALRDDMAAAAAGTAADPAKAIEIARAAVSLSPLNVTALATLADAERQAGDKALADRLYGVAYDHSKRLPAVLAWKLQQALAQKDVAGLVTVTDLRLRIDTNWTRTTELIDLLAELMKDPKAIDPLAEALLRRPPWAERFLMAAAQKTSADNVTDLLARLPPDLATDQVWSTLLARMIWSGQGLQAYALWTPLRGLEQSDALPYLNDGSFERMDRMLPFDWTIFPDRGVDVAQDRSVTQDGSNALRLTFMMPVPYRNLRQFLVLSPGTYSLTGKVKLDDLKASRGLQWRVYCASGNLAAPLGTSPLFLGNSDWTSFDLSFTVPPANCDVQLLRLEIPARIPAENAISGTAWFDDFVVTRQPDQPAPQG